MQLNFYIKRSNLNNCFYGHFFFYPNKENPIFPTDFSFEKTAKLRIGYKKLECHYVVEILKQAYFNGVGFSKDMFYPTYFFDPIHGYCKCHFIVNNYKKHKHKAGICDCVTEIEFSGVTNYLLVNAYDQAKAREKWGSFKKGFQRVLYVEPMIVFDVQVYLVCSVNVMDIKPVHLNTYDVGISYDFIHSDMNWNESTFSHLPMGKAIEYKLGHFKDIASSRFESDKCSYKETCVSFIDDWVTNGYLPKDQYYVHVFNLEFNKDYNNDRIYISRSDYEACQSFFNDEIVKK